MNDEVQAVVLLASLLGWLGRFSVDIGNFSYEFVHVEQNGGSL